MDRIVTKEKTIYKSSLGCLSIPVTIAGLAVTLALGPIDLCRSVYNQIIGDTPVLKRQLVDYIRHDIAGQRGEYTTDQINRSLANELGYRGNSEQELDPQKISITRLWDSAEDHAGSFWQRFIWTRLKD